MIPTSTNGLTPTRADLWKRLFGSTSVELIQSFEKYHDDNPHIYKEFMRLTRIARESGRERFSAWLIINALRWEHSIQTKHSDFKISNDHIAIYARLAIWDEPSYEGFFELKTMNPNRWIRKPKDDDDFDDTAGPTFTPLLPSGPGGQRLLFDTSKPAERC